MTALSDQLCAISAEMRLDTLHSIVTDLSSQPPTVDLAVTAIHHSSSLLTHRKRLHKALVHSFSPRFPDLASLIPDYEVYARAASHFSRTTLPDDPDLLALLTPQQIVALNLALSARLGPAVDDPAFDAACALQIEASELTSRLSALAASAVSQFSPNVCALVGPALAAVVISLAGGLRALSVTPGCNVKAIGAKKGALLGFSIRGSKNHEGILFESAVVREAPPELRDAVFRDLANKVALASRIDAAGEYADGSYGERTREEIVRRLDKKLVNATAKVVRPLAVPGLEKKTARGGRQKRANKKKFGMGEELRRRSRVAFGLDGQFDEVGEQFGAAALDGFRRRHAAVDAPFQMKIDKKVRNLR
jgi:U4/U6 small nuclear ribonucleoprotein PRP31